MSAEFGRLREFLLQEEERVKERLQREKEKRLNQLEEALKHTTEQIGQLEQTADQLHIKLREEENPAQLRVRGERKRKGEGEGDRREEIWILEEGKGLRVVVEKELEGQWERERGG